MFAAVLGNEHELLKSLFDAGFKGIDSRIDILIALILGCYVFASGSYIFTWMTTSTIKHNHLKHIEDRLDQLESALNDKAE